jgi:serine/threonine protein phosphatase PrpC
MIVTARTDLGRVRANNEDAFGVVDFARGVVVDASTRGAAIDVEGDGALFVVADGMGGAAFGEVAARLSIDALRNALADRLRTIPADRALREGVVAANRAVFEAASEPERKGMGSTLVAALVHGEHAYFTEVGDSRAYVSRQGVLTQVSHDQSYTQMLLDAGALKREDVAEFPMKNVILQAMGTKLDIDVPLRRLALCRGDRLLLCTDGLSGLIGDQAMQTLLAQPISPWEVVDELIASANAAGGDDNITVVLAEVAAPAPAPARSVAASLERLHEFSVKHIP